MTAPQMWKAPKQGLWSNNMFIGRWNYTKIPGVGNTKIGWVAVKHYSEKGVGQIKFQRTISVEPLDAKKYCRQLQSGSLTVSSDTTSAKGSDSKKLRGADRACEVPEQPRIGGEPVETRKPSRVGTPNGQLGGVARQPAWQSSLSCKTSRNTALPTDTLRRGQSEAWQMNRTERELLRYQSLLVSLGSMMERTVNAAAAPRDAAQLEAVFVGAQPARKHLQPAGSMHKRLHRRFGRVSVRRRMRSLRRARRRQRALSDPHYGYITEPVAIGARARMPRDGLCAARALRLWEPVHPAFVRPL
ncbi:hypothetical protein FB451DRAFT_1179558 [Mycena latifolia]|nr:hypothetical protein FB451DRAFT_1179558 [Mycena latifolia]